MEVVEKRYSRLQASYGVVQTNFRNCRLSWHPDGGERGETESNRYLRASYVELSRAGESPVKDSAGQSPQALRGV